MAKILGEDGQVYQSLSIDTFTEPEIQRQIKAKSDRMFPGFTYVPCEPLIVSDTDARKPDFVLIENEYRSWWIGEVEKSSHDFHGHVMPQVTTFADGYYDETHVKKICSLAGGLDLERLMQLVYAERPGILVVVDQWCPTWIPWLEPKGAKLALFEVFRSASHRYLFRINGFTPMPPVLFESRCYVRSSMPDLLHIASPAALKLERGKQLGIIRDGIQSDWTVVVAESNVWLRPVGGHSLRPERPYRLMLHEDGTYELKETRR